MNRPSLLLAALAVAALAAGTLPAAAQTTVYRCGNEYTNQVRGRTDCRLVEGGNVTIIQGTSPAPRSAPARPAAASTPKRNSSDQSQSVAQERRKAEAKSILEQELARAEKRQAELEAEYKDGQPDKLGPETKNYQKYLDRVAELEAAIERNQSDIEGIRRELDRFQ